MRRWAERMGDPRRPAVSCVVPTFESAAFAGRCIASILGQSLTDLEVIVTDDSASDAVERLVREMCGAESRVRYLKGARTANPVDNWNQGLDAATGDYTVLVHHDEAFTDPEFLARAVARLGANPGRALATGLTITGVTRPSGFRLASLGARLLRPPAWTLYLSNWIGPTACVVFPTAAAVRFDRRLAWTVDVDFYARLWARTGGFLFDRRVSVLSTVHSGQITARMDTLTRHRDELALLSAAVGGPLSPWQVTLGLVTLALRRRLRGGPRAVAGAT